jgi:hypothetical protein
LHGIKQSGLTLRCVSPASLPTSNAVRFLSLETPPGSTIVDLSSELATTAEFVNIIDRVVPEAGTLLNIDGPAIPSNIPPQPH